MRSLLLLIVVATAVAGCGKDGESGTLGAGARSASGYEAFATANTTRINGADPVQSAAAAARAAFPRGADAVVLADTSQWQTALAASVFLSGPLRAPTLLTRDGEIPQETREALAFLDPQGAARANGAQIIRIGSAPTPKGLKLIEVPAPDAFNGARSIDTLQAGAARQLSDHVIVTSTEEPEWAMPAASLAARSGAPILFTRKDKLPPQTAAALDAHGRPRILLIGNEEVVSEAAEQQLADLGTVVRIGVSSPTRASIAIARLKDPGFGWGIVDPGHGLVFTSGDSPLDAVAAAPLAVTGAHAPLLVTGDADELSETLALYLRSIRPGYRADPARAVYNHGWLIGDTDALSVQLQSRIDGLLAIRRIGDGAGGQR